MLPPTGPELDFDGTYRDLYSSVFCALDAPGPPNVNSATELKSLVTSKVEELWRQEKLPILVVDEKRGKNKWIAGLRVNHTPKDSTVISVVIVGPGRPSRFKSRFALTRYYSREDKRFGRWHWNWL